jgi:hypothetical protein
MVKDGLITITQGAPLGRQKVRDHDGLAITLGLWQRPAGLLSPRSLAAIILIEGGLIVGNENKSKGQAIGHWESVWVWEFTSIIVPLVEALFVSLPPPNELASISHDVLPLMAIDVHPVPDSLVSPIKLLQPAGCSLL